MTNTNEVGLAFSEEATYGVDPLGTSSGYVYLRTTNESLHQETSTTLSAELRDDRQVPAVTRTNLSVAGDTNFELSFDDSPLDQEFNVLLQAALMCDGDWSTDDKAVGVMTIVSSTNKITTATTNEFVGWTEGMWIKIVNSETTNDGYFKIKTHATNQSIYVEQNLEDEIGTNGLMIIHLLPEITQGTLQRSFSFNRLYEGIGTGQSGYCEVFTGMMIDGFNLTISPESIITGSFSWLGKQATSATAKSDTNLILAANTNDPMNAVDNVKAVFEGKRSGDGDATAPSVDANAYATQASTSFSFSLSNNLRTRMEIATLGAASIGSGTCNVTGTLQKYYANDDLMDKYLSFTESSVAIVMEDTQGNAYIFDIPAVKFTSGQRVAGGQDQDVIADMNFESLMDAVETNTIRIAKFNVDDA